MDSNRSIEIGGCYKTFGRHYYLVREEDTLHINNSNGVLVNTLEQDFLETCRTKPRRVSREVFDKQLSIALSKLKL